MKKLTYIQFVEASRWFRDFPKDRTSYLSKISRLTNSIQKDVVEGPSSALLTFEEQNTIKDAVSILSKLRVTLENAKSYAIRTKKHREYEVAKVYRHEYRKLIRERLSLNEANVVDVFRTSLLVIYSITSNVLDVERYVRFIEVQIAKNETSPDDIAKYIIYRYAEELDKFAYKFYSSSTEQIDYGQFIKSFDDTYQFKDLILKPYAIFFSKLSEVLDF